VAAEAACPLDLVPEKLESLPYMHDPRFLRMQLCAQLAQNPKRSSYRRPRLFRGCTGDYPVIRVPRESISLASHLLIKNGVSRMLLSKGEITEP
jgi:hypothetical protein